MIANLALEPQPRLTIVSEVGVTNQIQSRTNLGQSSWLGLTNLLVDRSPYEFVDASATAAQARYYRVVQLTTSNPLPTGMALIPAGSFTMGNCMAANEGFSDELPLHSVYVSAFYMDTNLVSKTQWDEVYQWAITNGYSFDNAGSGKAANHPVQTINWFDAVKWCNARSEKEGRVPAYYTAAAQTNVFRKGQTNALNDWVKWTAGYRLPTEAEWEKAARGGTAGHRFAWSDVDTISHSRANYFADTNSYAYDVSPTPGYHPAYASGGFPYTSPVGSFAANGYGLYDMTGNVFEWCWDWYDPSWYGSAGATQDNTRGPAGPSSQRVLRGGVWDTNPYNARFARCSYRYDDGLVGPSFAYYGFGFRCVRGF
jgi:formylglycine-generating enzyme required for sulfatase activity